MARLSARLGLTRYEADEYYKLALTAFNKKDLEDAIHNITAAIELMPYHAEYYAARGLFYLQDGVNDKAGADFDAALKRHAYEMLANYGRGVLAYQEADYEVARDYFRKAWAMDKNRPETLYHLAMIQHRLGDNEAALETMQRTHELLSAAPQKDHKKNARNAEKWVKEFQKIIDRANLIPE